METFTVWIKTDGAGCITAINSSAFLTAFEGWQQIDEGYSAKHQHAQVLYLPLPLRDEEGCLRYRYAEGQILERTAEEMAADKQTPSETPGETTGDIESRLTSIEQQLEMLLEGVTTDE